MWAPFCGGLIRTHLSRGIKNPLGCVCVVYDLKIAVGEGVRSFFRSYIVVE